MVKRNSMLLELKYAAAFRNICVGVPPPFAHWPHFVCKWHWHHLTPDRRHPMTSTPITFPIHRPGVGPGEATCPECPATVHGAYISGRRAACQVRRPPNHPPISLQWVIIILPLVSFQGNISGNISGKTSIPNLNVNHRQQHFKLTYLLSKKSHRKTHFYFWDPRLCREKARNSSCRIWVGALPHSECSYFLLVFTRLGGRLLL